MSRDFEKSIQKWVTLDNQLKILNEKSKEVREEKNDLLEDINMYIETNRLTNASIDISDGKLKFTQSKITQPLTLKFVDVSSPIVILLLRSLSFEIEPAN